MGNDILNIDKLMKMDACDVVVHLAANTNVQNAFEDAYKIYKDNILGTLNMLEYCRVRKVKRFVFLSSYVYGTPKYLPIDEFHPLDAGNPYGQSKVASEMLVSSYGKDFGIEAFSLRCFNVYGSGQNKRFIIPHVIEQLFSASKEIKIRDLKPKRDFLYIKDVINALRICCLSKDISGVQAFNIGYGQSHSVKEIIDLIFKISGRSKPVVEDGTERKNEIPDCVADIAKANKTLGWTPKYSIGAGLEDMLSAYKESRIENV
jgi:UDP-glucose 4-epimerase